MITPKERLWTGSFISACIGNFLLFFAFYLLVPIFPLYLIDTFDSSKTLIGIILSSYTVAALLIRPFAGFLLDMVNRKPIYLLSYFLFVITFVGYPIAHVVGAFLAYRIIHGLTFGFVTTAGNSLMVDIMPASRRGEGLGYFGIANTIAMAVGPMTSLLMHDYYTYNSIFYVAIAVGLIGFLFVNFIKSKKSIIKTEKQPVALDRFFLLQGFQAGWCLLLMGIPYGIILTYIAIYGKEIGISSGLGVFFILMSVGLTGSRLVAGKMVDRGRLVQVIAYGTAISLLALLLLSAIHHLQFSPLSALLWFYGISVLLGVGYGMIFPAYNTLFVNLAPNNRRATASSTYMTSWDIGIGIGSVAGGFLADSVGGLPLAFMAGALAVLFSLFHFVKIAGPHFERNKLR